MLSMNLIAPLPQLDIYHLQELIFIHLLQEQLELCMALSMEELTKLSWECCNKSGKRRISLNSSRTLRTEKNYCMDLVTEFTRVMILGLKSSKKLLMKFSKSLENKSLLKSQCNWKRLLWAINILFKENFILMLISIVALFTRQWDSLLTCSQFFSWSLELLDGLLIGMNFWMTQRTRLLDQGKIMSVITLVTSCL
jgi:hypothetical protein